MIPSVVIDDQKLLARIPLLIQQRGGQDLQFAAGQPYTDKTHRQFQRQAQSSQLRSLIGRRQQPHRLAATGSIHAKQFLRRSKRTARTTRDVVQSQMMMPSQIGIAREASIIHQHISRLAQGQLLDGQLDLAQPTGFQAPIQSDAVQQIIEHRHPSLGVGRPRVPQLITDFYRTKLFQQFPTLRQAQQRTVYAQQPVTPPAAQLGLLLRSIDRGQHRRLVQFNKSRVLELGACVGPGSGRHRLKQLAARQLVQKLMQMALDRFDGLLQDKQHDDGKGQLPLSREVFGAHAMARAELHIAKLLPQFLDKTNDMSGNAFNNCAHPHSK